MGFFDFLKIFGHQGPSEKKEPGLITGPRDVWSHLLNVCEGGTPLNLQIDDRHELYASIFLKETSNRQGMVLIDSLTPKEGNDHLEHSQRISLHYTYQKRRFIGESRFLGTTQRRLSAIQISMPLSIEEAGRQKFERFGRPMETPLRVRLSHMEGVCDQSIPVELQMDGSPEKYHSVFAKVSKGADPIISIEILSSREGNKKIAHAKSVTLFYQFQNRRFTFTSDFLRIAEEKLTALKLAVPESIHELVRSPLLAASASAALDVPKADRRKFKRVRPSAGSPLHVFLGYGRSKRQVANISAGGTAFYTRLTREQLQVGTVFHKMTLILPGDISIEIPKVVVRSLVENAAPARQAKNRCSVEFFGLSLSDQQVIEGYIKNREKEDGMA